MGRSSGVMITVKVPVKWDVMTDRQKTRLSRITSRDTRVIKGYLRVIERHERNLIVGKNKKRLDAGKIDKLTLRTETRNVVPQPLQCGGCISHSVGTNPFKQRGIVQRNFLVTCSHGCSSSPILLRKRSNTG